MPYASDAQRRYFNVAENKRRLTSQGVDVDEWNDSSRGKKLPEKVKDGKPVKGARKPPRKEASLSFLRPSLLSQEALFVLGRVTEKHHRRSDSHFKCAALDAVRRLTARYTPAESTLSSVLGSSGTTKEAESGATAGQPLAAVGVMLRAMRKKAVLRGPLSRKYRGNTMYAEKAAFQLPPSQGSVSGIGTPSDSLAQLTDAMKPHDPQMGGAGGLTGATQQMGGAGGLRGAPQLATHPSQAVVGGGPGAGATSPAQNPIGQYGLNDNMSFGTNFGQPMNSGGLKTAGEIARAAWSKLANLRDGYAGQSAVNMGSQTGAEGTGYQQTDFREVRESIKMLTAKLMGDQAPKDKDRDKIRSALLPELQKLLQPLGIHVSIDGEDT